MPLAATQEEGLTRGPWGAPHLEGLGTPPCCGADLPRGGIQWEGVGRLHRRQAMHSEMAHRCQEGTGFRPATATAAPLLCATSRPGFHQEHLTILVASATDLAM